MWCTCSHVCATPLQIGCVDQSTTLDESTKQKLKPLLCADYMSSDESVLDSESENDEYLPDAVGGSINKKINKA